MFLLSLLCMTLAGMNYRSMFDLFEEVNELLRYIVDSSITAKSDSSSELFLVSREQLQKKWLI